MNVLMPCSVFWFKIYKHIDLSGINWDQSKLGRYPDRKDLDSLKIKKPVGIILI